MIQRITLIVTLLLSALTLSGCGQGGQTTAPEPTLAPTRVAPTASPVPPTPTDELPTSTPPPAPSPTPAPSTSTPLPAPTATADARSGTNHATATITRGVTSANSQSHLVGRPILLNPSSASHAAEDSYQSQ